MGNRFVVAGAPRLRPSAPCTNPVSTPTHPPTNANKQAVGSDSRLRAFFTDDSLTRGLLFGCKDAAPLLDMPLGE